jgi:predicted AAA+ superfamily ATPase
MYTRTISLTKNNNFFLFGARSTGKTTIVKSFFPEEQSYIIDLLEPETEDRHARNPGLLAETINQCPEKIKFIIIDEVQKVPRLLSVIHQVLQNKRDRFHFILTGSSARKLKRGGADLLAGRAFVYYLFPLARHELGNDFNLSDYLNWGGLPEVFRYTDKEDKANLLRSYALTYLKEEVQLEQLVRNLDPFRGFLTIAAQSNGEILNYSKIAREASVATKTIQQYYDILCETQLGFYLEAWHNSARKRFISAPKFYLIDPGVKRALENTLQVPVVPNTYAWGKSFEHFIITQCWFLNHYLQKDFRFYYLKTKDGAEVDLIIEKPGRELILVEIKSKERSEIINTKNLNSFYVDLNAERALILSQDKIARKKENIEYLHWDEGLNSIFDI